MSMHFFLRFDPSVQFIFYPLSSDFNYSLSNYLIKVVRMPNVFDFVKEKKKKDGMISFFEINEKQIIAFNVLCCQMA
jgi:hypothetical protein